MSELQLIELERPIPSFSVYEVRFIDNSWKFVYAVETPEILTEEVRESPLYVDGAITNLSLSDNNKKNMVNLKVSCYGDLIKLFNRQLESDLKFRKKFLERMESQDVTLTRSTFSLTNEDHHLNNKCYIVEIENQSLTETVFVGRK